MKASCKLPARKSGAIRGETARKQPPLAQKPKHLQISRAAHALYEKEGRPDGRHTEHWFNAESMIEANFDYGESHTEHDFSKEPQPD